MNLRERYDALPRGVQFLAKVAASVVLVLILLFFVPSLWNRASNWWWGKGTERQKAEIEVEQAEAAKWKAVAQGALGELENAKRQMAEDRRLREEAERILADTRKTTKAARAEYDAALNRPPATPDFGAGTNDLCERARRLGVECPPE